ncbi:MAG: Plastocyanin [Candidatus Levybacteria bacterium GW2011_GWB1_37_8]|nr:MAG: Plastocyanin [Candidatus Levybacteria bacterium GW2011_GWB1_37_8]
MNKAIWGVLGVLIIIGFGVFLLNKNSQVAVPTVPAATEIPTTITSTDSAAPSTTESIVVTYFDSGFSPTSLTVKIGDTITFKNQSGKSMWVASSSHPTHTAYPEFDAKRGVTMGENYVFTFTKAGNWKYHNHLGPFDTGVIIVQ